MEEHSRQGKHTKPCGERVHGKQEAKVVGMETIRSKRLKRPVGQTTQGFAGHIDEFALS